MGRLDTEAHVPISPWRSLTAAIVLAVLLALMLAGSAKAAFGIANADAQITDSNGATFIQAGGHPFDFSTEINFNTHTRTIDLPPFGSFDTLWPEEPVKDLTVSVPPGLIGNPTVTPKCTTDQLAFDTSQIHGPLCPAASQIGTATVTVDGIFSPFHLIAGIPVYNMVPPPGVPARFGFTIAETGVIVVLDANVRNDADYRVSVSASNLSQGLAVLGSQVTLWGVPGDPAHDPERACPGFAAPPSDPPASDPSCPSQTSGAALPQTAFLRMPTSCPSNPSTTGLPFSVLADSYVNPGVFKSGSFATHVAPFLTDADFPGLLPASWGHPQGTTGCADVPFDPTFTAKPTTPASPGASGYVFDLNLPQTDDPKLIGEGDLKKAVVTLPAGVRVSPSEADGLQGCSPAQIALHSQSTPTCPNASKIGTVGVTTPLLDQPLQGSVYLATPHNNPSHSLLGLYIVAQGSGVTIKLPGSASPNARTGQLTATFDNTPQLPFSNFHLEFFGGDRAPLTNPPTCGTYTTHAVMTSWSGKVVTSDSTFTTSHDGHGAPCPAPQFKPGLVAGTTNPIADQHSPLLVSITRSDQDQELASIDSVHMPDGLTATIKGVKRCPGAAAHAGRCPASSRIGTVTAAAGPGPDPFAVTGRVYLGSRYKHAPFSLVFEVPVIAGPFDLGQITLRAAINVDRHNATLRVASDPLPTILQGIPLQVRLVKVLIDRPHFVLNPTSCSEKHITSTIRSTGGLVAHPSIRFEVASCDGLGLAPKMTLRVGGRGHTGLHASTPLTATLTMPQADQTNLKSVSVSLPDSLNARLDVVNNACTQAQFDAGHCEQARAGSAVAVTPLLDHALRGGVYFVKDPTKPLGALPNLVVALRGQVSFDLVGKITIPGGVRLATHFTTVPDVPIKRFTLRLVAGSHGPVGTAVNLCSARAKRQTARITFRGQNGLSIHRSQRLHVAGCHRRPTHH